MQSRRLRRGPNPCRPEAADGRSPPGDSGFRLVDGPDGNDHVGNDEADGEGEDEQVSEHISDVFRPEPMIDAEKLACFWTGDSTGFARLFSPIVVLAGYGRPAR